MLLSLKNILTLIEADLYEKKRILNDEEYCHECDDSIEECDDEELEEQSTTASMAGVNLPLGFSEDE